MTLLRDIERLTTLMFVGGIMLLCYIIILGLILRPAGWREEG